MKLNPVTQYGSTVGSGAVRGFFALVLFAIVGVVTWQLGQVDPPAPYRTPLLHLHLAGATVGNFDLREDDFIAREVSPVGFVFATGERAGLRFQLEFSGASEATQGSTYNLSADYPLTLILLDEREVSATFTATEGTVEFSRERGRVTAFMTDERGRDLFLGANFVYLEDEGCSETYRFCFNAGGEVAGRR